MIDHLKIATLVFDRRPSSGAQTPTEYFREINTAKTWRSNLAHVCWVIAGNPGLRSHFHTVWTECGHRMREQYGDDNTLVDLLWMLLPSYEGPDITLYRGENVDRWEDGHLGFCWTPRMDKAKMFGNGLNAVERGGVLLRCIVRREAIICGPSPHSVYLDEHETTVDPSRLENVEEIERYGPSLADVR